MLAAMLWAVVTVVVLCLLFCLVMAVISYRQDYIRRTTFRRAAEQADQAFQAAKHRMYRAARQDPWF